MICKNYIVLIIMFFVYSLLCIGISDDNNRTLGFIFRQILIYFLGLSFILTCIGDLYVAKNNLILIGEDLCVLVGIGLIATKYILFSMKYSDIKYIAQKIILISIKDDETHGRTRYLYIQKLYIFIESVIIIGFHILGLILFFAIVFVSPSSGDLPIRALFPFDLNNRFIFVIAYTYQSICIFLFIYAIIVMDTIAGILWHQISMQLLILSNEFKNISHCAIIGNNQMVVDEILARQLRLLIMKHQYIIKLSNKLNSVTSPMLAAQILSSNFTICLTGFEAILTYREISIFLRFFVHFSSALCQLLFWCSYGDNVQWNSNYIADSIFSNVLYSSNKQYVNNLRFVLFQAQRPIQIKAGRLYILSLETFLMILRGSYSYFALLRTLSES